MHDTAPECPKCHGQMENGFVIEIYYGGRDVSRWLRGPAQKSFWTGIKSFEPVSIPIGTFRCTSCGFLESYARHEFAPK
jgi:hypothetical protein